MTLGRLALSAVFMLASACVAPAGDDAEASGDAIQKGQTAEGPSYAVFLAQPDAKAACSGALIAPNLVLTARHCVIPLDPAQPAKPLRCGDRLPAPPPASQFFVSDRAVPREYGAWRDVAAIRVPDESEYCGADIALVILDRAYELSGRTYATPLLDRSRLLDRAVVDREIAAIGYGVTSARGSDWGARRVRERIRISCIHGDRTRDCLKAEYRSGTSMVAPTELVTEGGVCHGDSGSPAIEQRSFTAGTPLVIGVASRMESSGSTCGTARYTRTDAFASFVIDGAREAARVGGYDVPDWAR